MNTPADATKDAVPGYRLQTILGRGASGVVWDATHTATAARVALKLVRPARASAVRQVESEVASMARLNHPHLLGLYDYGRLDDGALWLALERVSGGSLEQWRPPDYDAVVQVLRPVLAGLGHAHARGLIHRDLKPENLLIATPDDLRPGLKVADFGMVWAADLPPGIRRGGTPLYIPPEQIDLDVGEPGPWSDLYALGAVLWRWLTGDALFGGDLHAMLRAHRSQPPPPFRPQLAVPACVEPLLRQMLSKDPRDRPGSCAEVAEALGGLPTAGVPSAPTGAAPSAPIRGLGVGLIGQREVALLGRQAPLAVLHEALTAVQREGRPRMVLVTGAEGVGKSHLLRSFAAASVEAGRARVTSSAVAEPRPAAVPSIVVLDPLDATRAQLAVDRLFLGGPVLVLAACSTSADHPELSYLPGYQEVELGPLDSGAMRALLIEELGLEPDVALPIQAEVDGVPGVAVRWLAALAAEGRLRGGPTGIRLQGVLSGGPPSAGDALASRVRAALATLPADARLGVQLGAVLGPVVAHDEWAAAHQVAGCRPREAGVREMVREGWARREGTCWRWTDAAARRQVVALLRSPERHHAVVAQALATLPADATRALRRARHLALSGQVDQAWQILAQTELETVEHFEAAQALLVALDGSARTDDRRFLRAATALRSTLNLVSSEAAVGWADEVVALAWNADGVEDIERHLRIAAAAYTFASRLDAARALLARLPTDPSTLRLLALTHADEGDHAAALAIQERALAEAEDPQLVARLENGRGASLARLDRLTEAVEAFHRAEQLIQPQVRYVPLGNRAMALLELGRLDDALDCARVAYALVQGRGAVRVGVAAVILTVCGVAADEPAAVAALDRAAHTVRAYPLEDALALRRALRRATPRQTSCVHARAVLLGAFEGSTVNHL